MKSDQLCSSLGQLVLTVGQRYIHSAFGVEGFSKDDLSSDHCPGEDYSKHV